MGLEQNLTDLTTAMNSLSIIKVIGVGGGGGNILPHASFGGGIGVLIGHRGQHGGQYSHHQQYKKHQAMAQ